MVHLFDSSQGRAVAIPPLGQRAIRLRTHLECPGLVTGWDELRALVVADVLLRALEMEGVQVFPALAVPDLPTQEKKRLDRLLIAYGLRVSETDDDQRADVHVLTSAHSAPAASGVKLRVGPTTVTAPVPPLPQGPTDHDATVRRCALLAAPCREPVTVSAAGLLDAATTLAGWRTWVAAWSRDPSMPVPPAILDRSRSLLDADLDTPGLLRLLGEVADDRDLPNGARFEVFVWLDQVLGMELSRDLGQD